MNLEKYTKKRYFILLFFKFDGNYDIYCKSIYKEHRDSDIFLNKLR